METVMFRIIKILIKLIDVATKPLKVRNRIVFISNYSDKLTENFDLIIREMEKGGSGYNDIKVLLHKYSNSVFGKFSYVVFCLKQVFYINTSKVVVIDTFCMSVSLMEKKQKVKVVQLWHASGAFKKFGHDIPNRRYDYNNTDYCIVTSSNISEVYSNALNVDKDKVLALGNPRTDCLFDRLYVDKTNIELRRKIGFSNNDIVVTYAPTLSKDREHNMYLDVDKLAEDFKDIDNLKFVSKAHPREKTHGSKNVLDLQHEKITDVLLMTDVLITDYSSIIFEFLINKSMLIFFAKDFENYVEKVGFYIDKDEFCKFGKVCRSYEELKDELNCIKGYDIDNRWVQEFYFEHCDGESTGRVVEFLKSIAFNVL
jgi:CDP-ribitol ribitolphosphotransferase